MSVKFQITVSEPLIQQKRNDPFEAITDLVDSAETDLAGRIDEILYR
jgi:hypothetical protein